MQYIPAFGFETSRCNADRERAENGDVMGATQSRHGNETRRLIENLFKGLAYIPFIGTVLGLIRIHNANEWNDGEEAASSPGRKFSHILRGSIEAFSLGALLIIPDIILTVYRESDPHRH